MDNIALAVQVKFTIDGSTRLNGDEGELISLRASVVRVDYTEPSSFDDEKEDTSCLSARQPICPDLNICHKGSKL